MSTAVRTIPLDPPLLAGAAVTIALAATVALLTAVMIAASGTTSMAMTTRRLRRTVM